MRVILEIMTGPDAGRRFELRNGQTATVGRGARADLALPRDSSLGEMHFVLECGAQACRLRDLHGSRGLFLNGIAVTEADLRDSDRIVAGHTRIAVRIEGGTLSQASSPPLTTPPPAPLTVLSHSLSAPLVSEGQVRAATPEEHLLQILRGQAQPLFALLDAARGYKVREVLSGSEDEFQSLYEGAQGKELADVAPYLARLGARSRSLERLVHDGWGQSWGVYLTCDQPFKEVRKHFRRFLLVKTEDGRELYFRFYDPRVLRTFLPTCTTREAAEFFGPVGRYLCEDEVPQVLLEFTCGDLGAVRRPLPLAVASDHAPVIAVL
jgi:Domain of unknown function (DUF4123)/Inner membrane component of T3SS, cytoplasmic domain